MASKLQALFGTLIQDIESKKGPRRVANRQVTSGNGTSIHNNSVAVVTYNFAYNPAPLILILATEHTYLSAFYKTIIIAMIKKQ